MAADTDVAGWLRAAAWVSVLTGAGISTESGIPDFRGPQGVWTRNPAAQALFTLDTYLADPALRETAWRNRLEHPAWAAQPNAGHLALVDLERQQKLHTLITQNIDGLHQLAGSDPDRVVEVHGTIREVGCLNCGERAPMEWALDRVRTGEEDPECRTCGGMLKSATISFGQSLIADDLGRAERAARECDLLLAIGSTLSVSPICDVVPVAKHFGATVVIVNADPTQFDHLADALVRGSISDVLPEIVGTADRG